MATRGTEHWRRAVRWTLAGIFAVALAGGLVGRLTGGGARRSRPPSRRHDDVTGRGVAPTAAARGTAALLRLSDLPSGWTAGGAAASRPG